MVGETIGQYRIVEEIGAGGMGIVYRAHDEKLDRDVAIKALSPALLRDENAATRMHKEALALSKVSHPNIASIFDYITEDGAGFLVMEFVAGQHLAAAAANGPLPLKSVHAIGVQVAGALDAAHERGVIHRDLKPENVMLSPKGFVKVLDFGVAHLVDPSPVFNTTAEVDRVSGTLPYMAPEQLMGGPPDKRNDLWSLGALLYQVATGQRPFPEQSAPRLTESILHEAPQPPSLLNAQISPGLEDIILKALEKDPELRYQSARELQIDLERLTLTSTGLLQSGSAYRWRVRPKKRRRWVWAVAAVVVLAALAGAAMRYWPRTAIDSVAVLPFTNETHSADADYLCDGIAEDLIDRLSQLPQLRVLARGTVFRFKGSGDNVQQIGRDLGVSAVVTGSVLAVRDDTEIRIELVRVSDGSEIWGEHKLVRSADLLDVQETLSNDISNSLRLKLNARESEALTKRHTDNPEAYRDYLKGRYFTEQYTKEGFTKAIEQFHKAIDADPSYAVAYVGIADAYYSVSSEFMAPAEAMAKMREATLKAMALDNTLPEAHRLLAMVDAFYDHDFPAAEREFRQAIELSPSSATAYAWYGDYLNVMGRFPEALKQLRKAQELDPLSPTAPLMIGINYYFARNNAEAEKQFRGVIAQNPRFWLAHMFLGLVLQQEHRVSEARAELQQANALGGSNRVRVNLAYVDAMSGDRPAAEAVLGQLRAEAKQEYVSPFYLALIEIALGNKDAAFQELEQAYAQHEEALLAMKVDPLLDPIRSDPRFAALLRRVGLKP